MKHAIKFEMKFLGLKINAQQVLLVLQLKQENHAKLIMIIL